MSAEAVKRLQERLGEGVLSTHAFRGDQTAVIQPARIVEACQLLRDDEALRFDMLSDLTAADHLPRDPRFEVVYHLYSVPNRARVRLMVQLPEQAPELPSVCALWPVANWLEREVWDMYGIRFTGHPGLKRILLYEEFEGHPLRKDYPKEGRQPLIRRPEHEIAEALSARSKGHA